MLLQRKETELIGVATELLDKYSEYISESDILLDLLSNKDTLKVLPLRIQQIVWVHRPKTFSEALDPLINEYMALPHILDEIQPRELGRIYNER